MKHSCSHLPHLAYFLVLSVLTTSIAEAAINKKPVASAGNDQNVGFSTSVTLDGRHSIDPDGSIKKYQWAQLQGPKVTLQGALTARPVFKTPALLNNKKPLALIFGLTVTDNQNLTATDKVIITVAVLPSGTLNDTGIVGCADAVTNDFECPLPFYLGQDAQYGRDKVHNNDTDGHAGFSFTKISSSGKPLAASATNWNCVKDNTTGLMWEIKTNDNRLHDKDWTYTWYDPDNTKNGGNVGAPHGGNCGATSACDTTAYVKAVNKAGWCGAKDWRMPSRNELLSIVSYDRTGPSIDTGYFPDTDRGVWFWSSSPNALYGNGAWGVFFNSGYYEAHNKINPYRVRLVRNGW